MITTPPHPPGASKAGAHRNAGGPQDTRGRGTNVRTITLPDHVMPIVDDLVSTRSFSRTVARLLWEAFGTTPFEDEMRAAQEALEEAERIAATAREAFDAIARLEPVRRLEEEIKEMALKEKRFRVYTLRLSEFLRDPAFKRNPLTITDMQDRAGVPMWDAKEYGRLLAANGSEAALLESLEAFAADLHQKRSRLETLKEGL